MRGGVRSDMRSVIPDKRFCTRCRIYKNIPDFYWPKGRGTPRSICKKCEVARKPRKYKTKQDRFWSNVEKMSERPNCWIWKGTVNQQGNGAPLPRFGFNKKEYPARRLAYRWARGDIPDGMRVYNTCENPLCVNPLHLFLGSDVEHGRLIAKRQPKGPNPNKAGERNPKSRFTESDIRLMRKLYAEGVSKREIGRRFDTSHQQVSYVVERITWKHIK